MRNSSQLFISTVRLHKAVSKDTTARLIKVTLYLASIDVAMFKPHCTWAAVTFRLTFLRMRNKCKHINVQRKDNHLWHRYHGLFVRMYITFHQSYLSQIITRQTSFEAYLDSKRKSCDCSAPKSVVVIYKKKPNILLH